MISEELNDLLSLLVATIFADKRVFAKEIETFMGVATKLQLARNNRTHLSEAKLLSWFDSNTDSIRKKMRTPEFEPWLYGCLERLSHIENKRLVIDIMFDIANSDDEYHVSEKALITLIANYWNIDLRLSA